MHRKPENDHEEAARLDRERTGDSVNARTDELKKELDREADRLQRKYVESGKSEADVKED
jgi:hypothetical protein